MIPALVEHRTGIAALCRRFHVRRLEVFGSAARGTDFDPAGSDIDLLVTYLPGHAPDIAEYADLRDALATLLDRPEISSWPTRSRTHSCAPASSDRGEHFM